MKVCYKLGNGLGYKLGNKLSYKLGNESQLPDRRGEPSLDLEPSGSGDRRGLESRLHDRH